jgi:hypothetical protein
MGGYRSLQSNNGYSSYLPSGILGDIAFVTDATAPTYIGALTGRRNG